MKKYFFKNFPLVYKFCSLLYRNLNFIKLSYFSGSIKEKFTDIYHKNKWKSNLTRSGTGSTPEQTKELIKLLPHLFQDFQITSIVDCPCGDFSWMRKIDLKEIEYVGYDIVKEIIEKNKSLYLSDSTSFDVLDVTEKSFKKRDLIFVRDLFVHFSYKDIFKALINIKKSNSNLILTTNFPEIKSNYDIATGQWRGINLLLPPFNFPDPIRIVHESNTEYSQKELQSKNLSLWKVDDIFI